MSSAEETPTPPRICFHLVLETPADCEQDLTTFFNSLFDIKKMVFIKTQTESPSLVAQVVVILGSKNNVEILQQPTLTIGERKVTAEEVSIEKGEEIIQKHKTKLYVGNIPMSVDNVKLWKHFAKYGPLDYSYILRKGDRKRKGFGFIIFKERDSFLKAITVKHYIDGQRLICKNFLNKNQLPRSELKKSSSDDLKTEDSSMIGSSNTQETTSKSSASSDRQIKNTQDILVNSQKEEDSSHKEDSQAFGVPRFETSQSEGQKLETSEQQVYNQENWDYEFQNSSNFHQPCYVDKKFNRAQKPSIPNKNEKHFLDVARPSSKSQFKGSKSVYRNHRAQAPNYGYGPMSSYPNNSQNHQPIYDDSGAFYNSYDNYGYPASSFQGQNYDFSQQIPQEADQQEDYQQDFSRDNFSQQGFDCAEGNYWGPQAGFHQGYCHQNQQCGPYQAQESINYGRSYFYN